MGVCYSAQNTTVNPQCGADTNCGNGTIKTSCKVSSATVPSSPEIDGEIVQSSNLKIFSLSELQDATSNFSPEFLLGRGDFGSVFKGLDDGTGIAVKMLDKKGCQGQQEWLTEIKYLGQLYHPNLVKLIGYCLEDEFRLLVYEYMANGSLEDHLFERAEDFNFQPLNWNLRIKVALDAAKCLAFLHYKADVIYRDFKTSNILLDSNYNAKLCDFGLARDGPVGSKTHVTTRVLGTEGYAAPEYVRTGHLTVKSDVYSFGIVLLEMISGRRAIEKSKPAEEQNLGCWARSINPRKLPQLLNPGILGEYSTGNVRKVVQLALQCVSLEPKYRPSMKDVLTDLEQVHNLNDKQHCRVSRNGKYELGR